MDLSFQKNTRKEIGIHSDNLIFFPFNIQNQFLKRRTWMTSSIRYSISNKNICKAMQSSPKRNWSKNISMMAIIKELTRESSTRIARLAYIKAIGSRFTNVPTTKRATYTPKALKSPLLSYRLDIEQALRPSSQVDRGVKENEKNSI